jgi:putative peptidoglycan lipid II flippase
MLGRDPQVNQPLTTAFAYLLPPQVISTGCRRCSWRS